jgi:NAD+ diphosphatase
MTLTYAGGRLDRVGARRKEEAWVAEQLARSDAHVVPSWHDRNLVRRAGDAVVPVFVTPDAVRAAEPSAVDWILLGVGDDGAPVFAAEVSEATGDALAAAAAGSEVVELRRVASSLGAADAALLAYARGMLFWQRRHRHCGVCGAPTASRHAGHVRVCTNAACGAESYPRTDPAVIMLVERRVPNEPPTCLLAHAGRFAPGTFSTLAGFVEPGESLEEAVAREVLEETGVRISSARYVASQPWPFPASLMIGFRALADTTDITVDDDELTDARWFTAADLRAAGEWGDEGAGVKLPRRDSIARRLIEGWLADVDAGR